MGIWRPSTSSSRLWKSWGSELAAGAGRLLLVLALTIVLPGPAVAAIGLDEAVQRVETTYGRMADLKATFEQAAFNRTLGRTVDAKGTLYLKKPGRFRWEYTTPTPQEIVSDGTKLWVYTPQLKQVNVTPAPQALTGPAGTFLQGLGQVREHFQVRFLNPAQPTDTDGLVVLDLTPKKPEPLLTRLILAVDPKSGLVRKAVVYDELQNTVTVRFVEVLVNSGLADALFVFVPPPGVAVVPTPGATKP
ncbi:MAG: outer membrane lipoprotein chaperone LolA [Candidatus Rokuibacteriota bacterium]